LIEEINTLAGETHNISIKEVTTIAVKAGEILLTSGAEIYRVEDTINRICKTYKVECESFVLPTGIFLTAYGIDGENTTLVKRIRDRTIDLERIELVNSFSRNLSNNIMDYDSAMNLLKKIEETKGYPFVLKLMAASLTAFVFVFIFQGNVFEGIAAAIIGSIIYFFKEKVLQVGLFPFLGFFISGIIGGGMSVASATLFKGLNVYKIIIGAIIILLPGMAITNGIKDALYGDITSSLNRLSEGIFIVTAVGAGVALILFLLLR